MIYQGRALATFNASRAVSVVVGALSFAALVSLYLWAVSLGLPNL